MDVAIIGGGIVGLTAAHLLKAEGKTVAVLESHRIVEGVTGNTTAKITSLHTLIYAYLLRHFGEKKALAYATANQSALEHIADTIHQQNIQCDFIRTPAFTYTESTEEIAQIEAEVQAAQKLGLPATLTDQTPLPFPVRAAVRFDDQAQFHPRKYLLALARDIPGDGSYLFEETRVIDITEGEPCIVTTRNGTMRAHSVIVASHYPVNDKTIYASRLHQRRSYVLAVRVANPVMRGTFISTAPLHSIRNYAPSQDNLLFVGGQAHSPGQGGDTAARYRRLEQWARKRFDVLSVEYRWSTQDNETMDRVPYVGKYAPHSKHLYVATGFGGWGMTNGTAAAMLLRDLIVERQNPWANLYDPGRVNLVSAPKLAGQTANIARHFVGDRIVRDTPDDVSRGEGKIVHTKAGNAAMYQAEDGTVKVLSPVCTHMGCFVQWNSAEKSWDCPCHGSRFAVDGKVIHGPAVDDLEELDDVL